jgi:hypothetical protein
MLREWKLLDWRSLVDRVSWRREEFRVNLQWIEEEEESGRRQDEGRVLREKEEVVLVSRRTSMSSSRGRQAGTCAGEEGQNKKETFSCLSLVCGHLALPVSLSG